MTTIPNVRPGAKSGTAGEPLIPSKDPGDYTAEELDAPPAVLSVSEAEQAVNAAQQRLAEAIAREGGEEAPVYDLADLESAQAWISDTDDEDVQAERAQRVLDLQAAKAPEDQNTELVEMLLTDYDTTYPAAPADNADDSTPSPDPDIAGDDNQD